MAQEKKVAEQVTAEVEENKIRREQEDLFKKAIQLNVNDHTDLKNNLTYLSWAWAWQEFLKICPEATYEIKKFTNPITGKTTTYLEDEDFGIMVFTSITARGVTREMWLPVMDGANKAMRRQAYTYVVGKGQNQYEKSVEAVSMFDINKTIMRCLTKNIAMFGVGLYIYAGEDLPIELGEPCTKRQLEKMKELGVNEKNVLIRYNIDSLEQLTYQQAEFIINTKEKALEKTKKESE
ncbi:MAG: DUF1071 domain-containing protein [Methanobrevibacter sp.]|nr:DUF1071 domain-containing protein [Methanobrevibacter sp.]